MGANSGLEDGKWAGGEFVFFEKGDFVLARLERCISLRTSLGNSAASEWAKRSIQRGLEEIWSEHT